MAQEVSKSKAMADKSERAAVWLGVYRAHGNDTEAADNAVSERFGSPAT